MERREAVAASVAIVKATYTKKAWGAKASVRYIEDRPGKDGEKITRDLFGMDGAMTREEAYQMIDKAQDGSVFYRFIINPDPKKEDTAKDLFLREITEKTIQTLEDRVKSRVQYVAAIHNDHTPLRHMHVIAIVPKGLQVPDFQAMRKTATEMGLEQRQELDLRRERQKEQEREAQWELQR
jgi:hypothetical protein